MAFIIDNYITLLITMDVLVERIIKNVKYILIGNIMCHSNNFYDYLYYFYIIIYVCSCSVLGEPAILESVSFYYGYYRLKLNTFITVICTAPLHTEISYSITDLVIKNMYFLTSKHLKMVLLYNVYKEHIIHVILNLILRYKYSTMYVLIDHFEKYCELSILTSQKY